MKKYIEDIEKIKGNIKSLLILIGYKNDEEIFEKEYEITGEDEKTLVKVIRKYEFGRHNLIRYTGGTIDYSMPYKKAYDKFFRYVVEATKVG